MKDVKRIDKLLSLIYCYWKSHPDWGFFQVMHNIGIGIDFYIDDGIIINMLQNAIDNSPVTDEQKVFIKEIEDGLKIEFNGKNRKEASEYIAKYLDEYMLRRCDTWV